MPTWDTATLFHRMRTITKTNKPLWDLHTRKYVMILCRGQFSIRINKPHNWLEQNGYLMAVKMAGTTKGLLGTLTMSIWSKLTTMDVNFVNTNQALSLFFCIFLYVHFNIPMQTLPFHTAHTISMDLGHHMPVSSILSHFAYYWEFKNCAGVWWGTEKGKAANLG